MYPYFRYFSTIIKATKRPKLTNPFEKSVVKMRVMPWDIDMFMELNNGRYLTIMDSARMDVGERLGLLKVIKEQKWGLMVGAVSSRYRHRLRPFEKFELHSQVIYYDERWFYFRQWFVGSKGKVNASCLVRTAVTSKTGLVPSFEVIKAMGYTPEELAEIDKMNVRPEWVAKWEQSDALHKEIMEG